jgi:calcium/proton exchanger cax
MGNVAEHSLALVMAVKDRMDVAVEIAVGSTTQIAMLIAPLAVVAAGAFGRPMSLEFIPADHRRRFLLPPLGAVIHCCRGGQANGAGSTRCTRCCGVL